MALGRKTGGRKKGTPNKITAEVKERMHSILNEDEGWEHIRADFKAGKISPQVFLRLLEYVGGKPTEHIKVTQGREQFAGMDDDALVARLKVLRKQHRKTDTVH